MYNGKTLANNLFAPLGVHAKVKKWFSARDLAVVFVYGEYSIRIMTDKDPLLYL
jgi:hypothetical protein